MGNCVGRSTGYEKWSKNTGRKKRVPVFHLNFGNLAKTK